MFIRLQIVGLFFGLVMLYFTNLFYRRKELTDGDVLFWGGLWSGFLIAVIFPGTFDVAMGSLGIVSAMQAFTVLGVLIMFLIVFFMYKTVRKTQRKTELLVKHIALMNRGEKKK